MTKKIIAVYFIFTTHLLYGLDILKSEAYISRSAIEKQGIALYKSMSVNNADQAISKTRKENVFLMLKCVIEVLKNRRVSALDELYSSASVFTSTKNILEELYGMKDDGTYKQCATFWEATREVIEPYLKQKRQGCCFYQCNCSNYNSGYLDQSSEVVESLLDLCEKRLSETNNDDIERDFTAWIQICRRLSKMDEQQDVVDSCYLGWEFLRDNPVDTILQRVNKMYME